MFGNIAPQKMVFVQRDQTEFIQQFEEYHGGDHDDVLDASAIALSELVSPAMEMGMDAGSLHRYCLNHWRVAGTHGGNGHCCRPYTGGCQAGNRKKDFHILDNCLMLLINLFTDIER